MKMFLLLLAIPLLTSETCKDKKEADKTDGSAIGIPACIQQRIDSIQKLPRFNPPAEVNEYLYKSKRVFLFSSDCCDMTNPLFDADCKYVCSPTGGITGKGDMSCMDFEKEAKHVRLVWKDPR